MSVCRQLKPNIYSVGAVDWDRALFDELIPLPAGTSYNAYLVKGSEKTALIDTVDPTMTNVLLTNLERLETDDIDYVISNHAEQDHSGSIPLILNRYSKAQVVTTPKGKGMLEELLVIREDAIVTVDDRATLLLGDKTLEFIYTPWVHWPETMVTYLREDNILFSCDFLGAHLATSDLFVTNEAAVLEAAKRYYAEIMMPFQTSIRRNLEKLQDLEIELIAPSHGPVYSNPDVILNAYREWVSDEVKNEVVIPYVSMHGSTRKMVEYFAAALIERGVTVRQFNLAKTDIGKLAIALVDAATLVIGSPTMLTSPHPNVVCAVYLVNSLRPKLKFVSIIGSYGWGSKLIDQLVGMIPNVKAELLDPVVIKGAPTASDFRALDRLADAIVTKHTEFNIIKREDKIGKL